MDPFISSAHRTRVLVVDDDPSCRLLVLAVLKRYGFSVALAKNAADAERRMADKQFELLVTDNHMPSENGLSFVRRLRTSNDSTLQNHRNIPIVMISGDSGNTELSEAASAGVHAFVEKPFLPSALGKLVKMVAAGDHKHFAHYSTLN
jgi:CheY-like chemotaxis protein